MFIYDVLLNDELVGDSGDEIFDTKAEAQADADDLIISALEDEYKKPYSAFEIVFYESCDNGVTYSREVQI